MAIQASGVAAPTVPRLRRMPSATPGRPSVLSRCRARAGACSDCGHERPLLANQAVSGKLAEQVGRHGRERATAAMTALAWNA